ncbi:MAG: hypothetical protein ACFCUI_07605 [Bernardetiaceae bacterium]
MKTFVVFFTLFHVISVICYPQNKTYIGFGLDAVVDLPGYTGVYAHDQLLVDGSWNIYLGHDINSIFRLESGAIRKEVTSAGGVTSTIPMETSTIVGVSGGINFEVWQIPFRLRSKLFTIDKKVKIFSRVGCHLSLSSYQLHESLKLKTGNLPVLDPDQTVISYTHQKDLKRNDFALFEVGLGSEFLIFQKMPLVIALSYFGGFQEVSKEQTIYRYADGSIFTGSSVTKGSYFSLGFSFSYPISEIWKKNK